MKHTITLFNKQREDEFKVREQFYIKISYALIPTQLGVQYLANSLHDAMILVLL